MPTLQQQSQSLLMKVPSGIAKYSATTESEPAVSPCKVGPSWANMTESELAVSSDDTAVEKSVATAPVSHHVMGSPPSHHEMSSAPTSEGPTSHHGSSEQWIEEAFAQIMDATSKVDQRSYQEFAGKWRRRRSCHFT